MKRSPSSDKELLGLTSRTNSRIQCRMLGLLVLIASFLNIITQQLTPFSASSSHAKEDESSSSSSMTASSISSSSSSSSSVSSAATAAATAAHSHTDPTQFHHHHLLSVPFYIYRGWGVSSWPNATLKMRKKEFDMSALDPEGIPVHSRNERKSKHADDYFLAVAARTHPMRTMDPSKAKLFFVPTPFNLLHERYIFSHKKPLCLEHVTDERVHRICNRALMDRVNTEMGQSKWFKRHQGKDHIVVMSHWMWTHLWHTHAETWDFKHLHKCNAIDWEGKLQDKTKRTHRITFPSYYVGKACPPIPVPNKTQDFSMVTTLVRSDINMTFRDRINICNWIQNKSLTQEQALAWATPPTSSNAFDFKMEICGIGHQCPALSQARFGFHAAGDTPGSNRPMDLLLSHTIPIFTRMEQYDVLPKWIDWDQISYFADVSNQTLFLQQLKEIVTDQETYQQKQQAVERNSDLFNFDTMVPFDTYMYMFQSKLFPETIHPNTVTSPYSALILP